MKKDRTISFHIQDVKSHRMSFDSLVKLEAFLKDEGAFWREKLELVASKTKDNHVFFAVTTIFDQGIATINDWSEHIDEWEDQELSNHLQGLNQGVFNNLPKHWLWSGHSIVEPFTNYFIKHGHKTATAFLEYVINGKASPISKDQLRGYVLGYEFDHPSSEITSRHDGEQQSLEMLRDQFAKSKQTLDGKTEELKTNFHLWESATKANTTRLYNIQRKLGERRIKRQNSLFAKQLTEWEDSISTLENTYEELLKLEKPANYWKKAAKKYGCQGGLWVIGIVCLFVVGIIYYRDFYVSWLQGRETALQLGTLQGAILFGSGAAVYAYLMRVLSKLAFSSYHLMRDAEEREQLTYLYLSLANNSDVDSSSRDIVLQALFSRSETGLLNGDHGPTMPTASELVKASSKIRTR